MFDRIARVYDPMNTAMSAGLHHRWRSRAADLARVGAGARVLDLATGTGDLALELAGRVWPGGEVVGADFSEAMLDRARAKAAALGSRPEGRERVNPRFEWADAMALPYPDDRFDAATVAFGARNFEDLARGLREMARVVRPGGRLVVCEFSRPTWRPFRALYLNYLMRALPWLARRVSSNPDAYVYLAESIRAWPAQADLARTIAAAGWNDVRFRNLSGGIVALHLAERP